MAIVTTDEANFEDIADAIRERNGSSETYYPSEMATAIRALGDSSASDAQEINDAIAMTYVTGVVTGRPELGMTLGYVHNRNYNNPATTSNATYQYAYGQLLGAGYNQLTLTVGTGYTAQVVWFDDGYNCVSTSNLGGSKTITETHGRWFCVEVYKSSGMSASVANGAVSITIDTSIIDDTLTKAKVSADAAAVGRRFSDMGYVEVGTEPTVGRGYNASGTVVNNSLWRMVQLSLEAGMVLFAVDVRYDSTMAQLCRIESNGSVTVLRKANTFAYNVPTSWSHNVKSGGTYVVTYLNPTSGSDHRFYAVRSDYVTDETLTMAGFPADASVTGDMLLSLGRIPLATTTEQRYVTSTGAAASGANMCTYKGSSRNYNLTYVEVGSGTALTMSNAVTKGVAIARYDTSQGKWVEVVHGGSDDEPHTYRHVTTSAGRYALQWCDAVTPSIYASRDGMVSTHDLSDGAVTEDKLADGAVTVDKIDPEAVDAMIGEGSITTGRIRDGAVTGVKLADGAALENLSGASVRVTDTRTDRIAPNGNVYDGTGACTYNGASRDYKVTYAETTSPLTLHMDGAYTKSTAIARYDSSASKWVVLVTGTGLGNYSVETESAGRFAFQWCDATEPTIYATSGKFILGSYIEDGAIGTAKLSGGAVTTDKVADGAVTPSKLGGMTVVTNSQILAMFGG